MKSIVHLVCHSALALVIFSGTADLAQPAAPAPDAAEHAGKILNTYCFRCHRGQGSTAGRYAFNARDRESLVSDSMVIPGDADNSQLLDAMTKGRMPPRNQSGLPRPTPEEVAVIKQWIEAKSPSFPAPSRRPFKSYDAMMASIYKGLSTGQC